MHVFAAEVYRQYIMKKRKNDKVVHIEGLNTIGSSTMGHIRGIRKEYRGRSNRGRTVEPHKERSDDLSQTEKTIFLDSLDKYFGLKLTTVRGGTPLRHTIPCLNMSSGFYVTENRLEMNKDQEEEKDDDSSSSSGSEIGRP